MFKKQKIKPYDRQQVLGILPFELKAKILRHLYAGAIQSVPLLKQMADDDMFLTDMCIRLQPYNCSANTYVYQRGGSISLCEMHADIRYGMLRFAVAVWLDTTAPFVWPRMHWQL
jgi:hypothetical protein